MLANHVYLDQSLIECTGFLILNETNEEVDFDKVLREEKIVIVKV